MEGHTLAMSTLAVVASTTLQKGAITGLKQYNNIGTESGFEK